MKQLKKVNNTLLVGFKGYKIENLTKVCGGKGQITCQYGVCGNNGGAF